MTYIDNIQRILSMNKNYKCARTLRCCAQQSLDTLTQLGLMPQYARRVKPSHISWKEQVGCPFLLSTLICANYRTKRDVTEWWERSWHATESVFSQRTPSCTCSVRWAQRQRKSSRPCDDDIQKKRVALSLSACCHASHIISTVNRGIGKIEK